MENTSSTSSSMSPLTIALIVGGIVILGIIIFLWFTKSKKTVKFDDSYQPSVSILNSITSPEMFKEYMKKNYTDIIKVENAYPLVNKFGAVVPVNVGNPAIDNKGDLPKLETLKNEIPQAIQQFTKLKEEREKQLKDTLTAPNSAFKSQEERASILTMFTNIITSATEIIKFLSK
jgi:nitrogen fixation-related uncharacterized protein